MNRQDIIETGGIASLFLTSAVGDIEWSASRSGCFTFGEIAPGTHWIGGWVGTEAGLNAVEQNKISYTNWQSNPGRPACQCTDWAILAPEKCRKNMKCFC
jgi:hypothetical protein